MGIRSAAPADLREEKAPWMAPAGGVAGGGRSKQDVCDWNPESPLSEKNLYFSNRSAQLHQGGTGKGREA